MGQILFGWAMGEDLGDLARDLPLAIACCETGHEVRSAVKDRVACTDAAREFDTNLVHGPLMRAKPAHADASSAINCAHLLWQTSFFDARTRDAVALGWRRIFRTFTPGAIVYDFASRALLPARLANILVVHLCNCAEKAARVLPLPGFRPWQSTFDKELLAAEARVVDRSNGVLVAYDAPAFDKLWRLYAEKPLLVAYGPDFDHLGPRLEATYLVITLGFETVADATSLGVPVLVVPSFTEQHTAGVRIEGHRVGAMLRKDKSKHLRRNDHDVARRPAISCVCAPLRPASRPDHEMQSLVNQINAIEELVLYDGIDAILPDIPKPSQGN